jgi:hypothetical protein
MRRLALLSSLVLAACGSTTQPAAIPIAPPGSYRFAGPPAAERAGLPIGRLRCAAAAATRFGVHLELFADARVILVPSGIGIAPPWRGSPPFVAAGRCSYPVRTRGPTGTLEVRAGTPLTLGAFFAIWGEPITTTRVASFPGTVRAFVNGVVVVGDPAAIRLRRHATIVLEVGRYVKPHRQFAFPPPL